MATNAENYTCPFDGNKPAIKLFTKDRISKIEGKSIIAGADFEIVPHPKPPTYYECAACKFQYEDISSTDIESFLDGIKESEHFKAHKEYYYPGMDAKRLILEHRTGIVRFIDKIPRIDIIRLVKRKGKPVIVCILFNKLRTFIKIERREDNDEKAYYVIVDIWRP